MEDQKGEARPDPEQRKARNGFLIGLCLLALSGYVFVTGWSVPRPEGWLTAPAMLPLLLGGSLFIMAVLITLDTIREGALRAFFDFGGRDAAGADSRPLWRTVFAMAMVGFFYFVLIPFLAFEIAVFLFLLSMMQFYWQEGRFRTRLALAVALPFIISGTFQGVFGIPLPGDGNLVQDFLYLLRH